MDSSFQSLIPLLLPAGLTDYFTLTSHAVDTKQEVIHLYLEEKNEPPTELKGDLVSKGFFEEASFQDFPIRGHRVFMHVKRRRWVNKLSGKVVTRDWDLIAKGTRITKDFAAFLKEISG